MVQICLILNNEVQQSCSKTAEDNFLNKRQKFWKHMRSSIDFEKKLGA